MKRHGKTWQDMARQGKTWQDMTRHGRICQDMSRHDKTWQDMARHGKTWQDITRHGKTWQDMAKLVKTWQNIGMDRGLTHLCTIFVLVLQLVREDKKWYTIYKAGTKCKSIGFSIVQIVTIFLVEIYSTYCATHCDLDHTDLTRVT